MSSVVDNSSTRLAFHPKVQAAVPKGFHVRVHKGASTTFSSVDTAKFDSGYNGRVHGDSRQNQNRYPDSTLQHVTKHFPVHTSSTIPPRSQLVDSTAVNRGYEYNARSATPRYSIYQSPDVYVYEPSVSSKSEFHSEYDPSTTFSPDSFYSPALSTDSLTAFKSPATTDISLPDDVFRSIAPAATPTLSYGSSVPGLSRAQSTLRGIYRTYSSEEAHIPQDNIYVPPTTRLPPTPLSTANSRSETRLKDSTRTNTVIRLANVSSADSSAPTTPISDPVSPVYTPSTASEFEQLERDKLARANAEYNAASSTSSYLPRKRNSVLVPAPIPSNRPSGLTPQIFPTLPLRSSPEQQAYVPAHHTVDSNRVSSHSVTADRRSPPSAGAPYQYAHSSSDSEDSADTMTPTRHPHDQVFTPSHAAWHDDLGPQTPHRSPEFRTPVVVPQFINEGPSRNRYIPASRTISPNSPPDVLESVIAVHGASTAMDRGYSLPVAQPQSTRTGASTSRERKTSITPASQPRVGSSVPSPPHVWHNASAAVSSSNPSHPPANEPRWDNTTSAQVDYRIGMSSGKYVSRELTIANGKSQDAAPQSSYDLLQNGANIPPARGVPPGRTPAEHALEPLSQAVYHRPSSDRDSPPLLSSSRGEHLSASFGASPSGHGGSSRRPTTEHISVPITTVPANITRGSSRPLADRDRASEAQPSARPYHQPTASTRAYLHPQDRTLKEDTVSPELRALDRAADHLASQPRGSKQNRYTPQKVNLDIDSDSTIEPSLSRGIGTTSRSAELEIYAQPLRTSATVEKRGESSTSSDSDTGTPEPPPRRQGIYGRDDAASPAKRYSSWNVDQSPSPLQRDYDSVSPPNGNDGISAPLFLTPLAAHTPAPLGQQEPDLYSTQRPLDYRMFPSPIDAPPPLTSNRSQDADLSQRSPPRIQRVSSNAPEESPSTSLNSTENSPTIHNQLATTGYRSQERRARTSDDESSREPATLGGGVSQYIAYATPLLPSSSSGRPLDRQTQERHRHHDKRQESAGKDQRGRITPPSASPETSQAREDRQRSNDSPRSNSGLKSSDFTKQPGLPQYGPPSRDNQSAGPSRLPPQEIARSPRRRHSDSEAPADGGRGMPPPEPLRRSSDGDPIGPPLEKGPLALFRTVRWDENLICPSPVSPSQRRKGWFNRRGDQLWTNSGVYKPPQKGEEYPLDLDGYPEYGEGWMNEEGVRIDMGHRLIPKTPRRSALKQGRAQ